MKIKFELCLPRDEASVPTVRHICRDALTEIGIETECIEDIEVALTEACTNVLKHVESSESEYEVLVDLDFDVCEIRVVDGGLGFDHAGVGGAEAAPTGAEGGRGIHLMNALVDRVRFESGPGRGTAVYLYKELTRSSDPMAGRLRDSVTR